MNARTNKFLIFAFSSSEFPEREFLRSGIKGIPIGIPCPKRAISREFLGIPIQGGFRTTGGVLVVTIFRLFVCPCDFISLHRPLYNWVPLAWKPHWRLKSPRPVKSIQHEPTESELVTVKWVCFSPGSGSSSSLFFQSSSPALIPGIPGNLMGIPGNLGNSRSHLLELGIPLP